MSQPTAIDDAIDFSLFIGEDAAAAKVGVPVRVVRDWAANGLLDYIKLPRMKTIRVSGPDLDALLAASVVGMSASPPDYPGAGKAFLEFLASHTEAVVGEYTVFADLYRGYTRWAEDRGTIPMNANRVGRALNSLGYRTNKDGGVTRKVGMRYLGGE